MPYDPAKDPFATFVPSPIAPGGQMSVVTAAAEDFTRYPKALTCWVPTGTASASITVLPSKNVDGATMVISLSEGRTVIDWVPVRAVTVIAAGVVVHRIDD